MIDRLDRAYNWLQDNEGLIWFIIIGAITAWVSPLIYFTLFTGFYFLVYFATQTGKTHEANRLRRQGS